MSIELKIKSKHLSLEAKVIRFEENKLRRQIDWLREHQQPSEQLHAKFMSIKDHRRWDVRNENRATFLARAYLAGTPYNKVEAKRKHQRECEFRNFILPRVLDMVEKYGPVKANRVKDLSAPPNVFRMIKDPQVMKTIEDSVKTWIGI